MDLWGMVVFSSGRVFKVKISNSSLLAEFQDQNQTARVLPQPVTPYYGEVTMMSKTTFIPEIVVHDFNSTLSGSDLIQYFHLGAPIMM